MIIICNSSDDIFDVKVYDKLLVNQHHRKVILQDGRIVYEVGDMNTTASMFDSSIAIEDGVEVIYNSVVEE